MSDQFSVVPFTPADDLVDGEFLVESLARLDEIREGIEAGEITAFAYVLIGKRASSAGYRRDEDRADVHHLHSWTHLLAGMVRDAVLAGVEEVEEDDDE